MKFLRPILALLLATMLTACATEQNHHDPIEPVNRVTDDVNDKIDRVTLKPVAEGYTYVLPKPMRTAVTNFFDNATYLNTVLNDFLQGKGAQGVSDLGRFLVNTTLGVGGMVDVASYMGLEHHEEDFGQTLAVWGAGQGAYIVYPLLGPNTARNTPDFVTATATDPLFWAGFALAPYVTIPLAALKYVDKRANLLDASDMRDEMALDPYIFTREAYRQNREYQIYDGNPPAKPQNDDGWEDDGWEEDEWDSADSNETTASADNSETTATKTGIRLESSPDDLMPASEMSAGDESPELTMETDINTTAESGKQVINLSSHHLYSEAQTAQKQLAAQGIDSELYVAEINGSTWYRLRFTGTYEQADIQEELSRLKRIQGAEGAWLENQ